MGGVRDSSATFYNPGALGFVTDPSLSVSANAFRYGQLKIYSALGSGQDATADLFDVVPLLVSGSAKLEWGHDWSVGYAILTRQQSTRACAASSTTSETPVDSSRGPRIFPASSTTLAR